MPDNDPTTQTNRGLPKPGVVSLATITLDGLSVVGFFALHPLLTQGFASQNIFWGALVVTGYLVLCLSTWMLFRIEPLQSKQQHASSPKPMEAQDSTSGFLAVLALCFGLLVVAMLIELTGAMERGGLADQLAGNLLAQIGVMAGILVFSLGYLFVIVLKPRPVVPAGTAAHFWQRLVATTGINLMFIITLAFWDASLAESEPMGLALGGRIFVFILFYAVMLIFLAPPRLVLHATEGSRLGLASFCFWLAVYTWKLTA